MTPDLPPDVEVHAWLQAGIEIPVAAEGQPGATIDMARLQTRVDTTWYGGMLQVDAAREDSMLLDAAIRMGSVRSVALTAGRFKTPLSLDFGVPAPKMVLPKRALLVSAAPQRELGAELLVHRGRVEWRTGAFDPLSDLERAGPGVRPITSLDWEPVNGLIVHAGATTWLRADEAERDLVDGPRWDDEADLALCWEDHGTTLALEGLAGHTVAAPHWEGGVTTLVAHRFAAGATEVEPAAGWDSATLDGALVHRATGAVNLHLDDWFAVARVSGEVLFSEPEPEPALVARAQLQVGF